MEFHIGDLVQVTNTLTHLHRRIGLVVDVKQSGDSFFYIQILTDCGLSRIIPGFWAEKIR